MHSPIDNSRPATVYTLGLLLVVVLLVAVSNIEALRLSRYVDFPHRPLLAAALFTIGALAGIGVHLRSAARAREPWRVPQAQASLLFIVYLVAMVAATLLFR